MGFLWYSEFDVFQMFVKLDHDICTLWRLDKVMNMTTWCRNLPTQKVIARAEAYPETQYYKNGSIDCRH